MTTQDGALELAEPSKVKWRQYAVTAGRIGLAVLLLLAWKIGAERAGPLYIADPVLVAQRIVTGIASGDLPYHIYVTLRLSAIGFAIGCFFGVALPFVLRRMPRFTDAVEPYIMASLKIALPRAVSAAIIGEFLVGNAGLGYLIEYSRQNFDTVGVFVGIVVATALVLIINAALVWLDRRVNAWRPTERDMQI